MALYWFYTVRQSKEIIPKLSIFFYFFIVFFFKLKPKLNLEYLKLNNIFNNNYYWLFIDKKRKKN